MDRDSDRERKGEKIVSGGWKGDKKSQKERKNKEILKEA